MFIYRHWFLLFNKIKYHREIARRAEIDLFDYKSLSNSVPFYPLHPLKDANYYGHYYWFKKFSNTTHFNHSIEHGLYIGSHIPKASFLNSTKAILTFSNIRRNHLINGGINVPIFPIGPYIHYCDSLFNTIDLKKIKKGLGSTLTIFPSHSSSGFNSYINEDELINEIETIRKKLSIKNVIACLYYQDIQKGNFVNTFASKGYKITTAGHRYDHNFLARLKSIISISDYTMSNSIGTHIGYCLYMNKPHYVFKQKVVYQDDLGNNSIEYRTSKELEKMEVEKSEIYDCFSSPDFIIKTKQKEIIDKYWGISQLKSHKELNDILC